MPTMLFTGRPVLYAARTRMSSSECAGELRCTQVNGSDARATNETRVDWLEDGRGLGQTISPWVHYVPLRNDLSDLIETVEWLRAHEAQAAAIAANGAAFARRRLTRTLLTPNPNSDIGPNPNSGPHHPMHN